MAKKKEETTWEIERAPGPNGLVFIQVTHLPSMMKRSRLCKPETKAVKEGEVELKQYIMDLLEDV
jgi:hypothetical protein